MPLQPREAVPPAFQSKDLCVTVLCALTPALGGDSWGLSSPREPRLRPCSRQLLGKVGTRAEPTSLYAL